MLKLPPDSETEPVVKINDRNLFKVMINSQDDLLVEDQVRNNIEGLRQEVKDFILNKEKDPNAAESPEKAIISLKTNRGTHYHQFISVLDELKKAYYEIYGEELA